ncbi:MAG TPA: YopX family protein [Segetibacter sp.]|jgi:uncharacterized phage protein (TIGR01671 family)
MINETTKFRVWDNVDYMSKPFTFQEVMERKIVFASACPVMQYTGLYDKNDKEVCEGDIYETQWNNGLRKVMFINGCFVGGERENSCQPLGWEYSEEQDEMITDDTRLWLEVVGNIYQNPELINP